MADNQSVMSAYLLANQLKTAKNQSCVVIEPLHLYLIRMIAWHHELSTSTGKSDDKNNLYRFAE